MKIMDVVLTNTAAIVATTEEARMEQHYKPYRGERFLCVYLGSIAFKRGAKLPNLPELATKRLEENGWTWTGEALDEQPWHSPEEMEDHVGLASDLARKARLHQSSPDNVLTQELLDVLQAHGYVVVREPGREHIDNSVSQLKEPS